MTPWGHFSGEISKKIIFGKISARGQKKVPGDPPGVTFREKMAFFGEPFAVVFGKNIF
jgi:hypothetical protein